MQDLDKYGLLRFRIYCVALHFNVLSFWRGGGHRSSNPDSSTHAPSSSYPVTQALLAIQNVEFSARVACVVVVVVPGAS